MIDPRPGERWEHRDGGTIYIVGRKLSMVRIQRRPFGDSLAEGERFHVTLAAFAKMQTGKLSALPESPAAQRQDVANKKENVK